MYFDLDSSTLTPSDTNALDAYAAAYVAAGSPVSITVEGFASVDGQADHNVALANARAKAVSDYLAGKGVDTGKIAASPGVVTDKFDKTDPRPNRRATLFPPPPKQPEPDKPNKTPKELYDLGYQMALEGKEEFCPDGAEADGEAAYKKGYAAGKADRPKLRMADRIKNDIKDPASLKEDIDDLSEMDMDTILDVMEALKTAGQLDEFRNHVPNNRFRVGTAALTILPEFDPMWQAGVTRMGPPDREAILKRIPPGTYPGTPSAPGGAKDPEDPPSSVQTDNVTKLETIATLTVLEPITKNKLRELQFTVHTGVNGTFTNFESDLKLFETKLQGTLGNVPFEVTTTVTFNNEVKFNTDQQQRITIDTVETHVKAALEVAAKGVKFRLEIKADQHGVTIEPVVEIPFSPPI